MRNPTHPGPKRAYQQPDLGCCATSCAADVDEDAPVPLCPTHLRIAFAYVVGQAEDVAAEPEDVDLLPVASAAPTVNPRAIAHRPGFVYFASLGGHIKIGWSADPDRRLRALGVDEVLHLQPGTMQDERRCHALFAHLRLHHEFFSPGPDLLAFIDDLRNAAAA